MDKSLRFCIFSAMIYSPVFKILYQIFLEMSVNLLGILCIAIPMFEIMCHSDSFNHFPCASI